MKIRIGTRRSPLALAQANLLASSIEADCEIVEFVTTGDQKQSLGEGITRDKKDWIFELEQALLSNKIDCAIHSAKDIPVLIADGTSLLPVLKRESPNDLLISKKSIDLKHHSIKIGTSSLRRIAQLTLFNPNLQIVSLRGNINTRIGRLDKDFDAIILAHAGVRRLEVVRTSEKEHQFTELDLKEFIPASNQGILACQFLRDHEVSRILEKFVDLDTKIAFEVERKLVEILGADCHSAVGIYCDIKNGRVNLNAVVYSLNKDILAPIKFPLIQFISCQKSSSVAEYEVLAQSVADDLIARGVEEYL